MTVSIDLGACADSGQPALLDLEELLSTRLLVQGNSGSGKSHLLRRLLEQSAAWVQQAIIDPEGDFEALGAHCGHLVIDASVHAEAELVAAGERMRAHRISVVLNLEGLDAEQQMRRAAAFLGGMFEAPREHWYPVLVAVDEAQLFAPAVAGEVSEEARRASLSAMTNLMCRGRKRGLAGVVATQRLAKLAKNVAAEATNFLMGRTFLDIDMARAADLLGLERRQADRFRDLGRGQFIALGPALSRRPLSIGIGPVVTQSRSAAPSLLPLPSPGSGAAPDSMRDKVLAPLPKSGQPGFRQPRTPAPPPPDLLAQLSADGRARQAIQPEPVPDTPETARAVRRLLAALLEDADAPFRPLPVLFQDFLMRARIAGLGREPLDLPRFRHALAVVRSGIAEDRLDGDDWRHAEALAALLPDDVQPVFLLLAASAIEGRCCPDDAAVARAYGTHSPARARRQLAWLEERNLLVLRQDGAGRRSAAIIGTAWETLPALPG